MPPTVEAENSGENLFGTDVSAMQTNLLVGSDGITGTLHKLTSGQIAGYWGDGYFMALKFPDANLTKYKIEVGLNPSVSSGLVELDSDKNGVFKVTDKDAQKLAVSVTDRTTNENFVFEWDLSELVLEE